ncbi:MAG TPA: hypothetical protein VFK50_02560 [Sphingomicrobium sp.]|nr:hypothetical protein [Sphingomicrobium sp.]
MRFDLILAGSIAMATTAANGQIGTPPRPDVWAQHYLSELAREEATLRDLGLGRDWDVIRAAIDLALPNRNRTLSGATHDELRRMDLHSATNTLVRFGYRARHVAAPQQARSLTSAATSGWADADALVLVAPIVLVADFVKIDRKPDNSADLVFRVTEPIKSSPKIGTEIRLRLNGPLPTVVPAPGAPPPPPPPPNPAMHELSGHKRAVFFLQPAATTVRPRGAELAGQPATVFGPMPISGNWVLPGYHSMTRPTTLAAIRATARAQRCSPGYVPVVPDADPKC